MTRALRFSLQVEESRVFWARWSPSPPAALARRAFEERWFGARGPRRAQELTRVLLLRFGRWPGALEALHAWRPRDGRTAQVICHWHALADDPLYRALALECLPSLPPSATVGAVGRWLDEQAPGRWSQSTWRRLASGLVATAQEAGICAARDGALGWTRPEVTGEAAEYLSRLLRSVGDEGKLWEHAMTRSVGLAALTPPDSPEPLLEWARRQAQTQEEPC